MQWSELHAKFFGKAFEIVLGKADPGAMAFVRCLTPDVVKALAEDVNFTPTDWNVWRVADNNDSAVRTISADRAVEIRETKQYPTLLLVDTSLAGAGMDGIYSAAHEIDEKSLFGEALRLARREVTHRLSRDARQYAELAVKKARGFGHRFSISCWTEFDFLIKIAINGKHPGDYLHLLGLWPVQSTEDSDAKDDLERSRMFVDRLLGAGVSRLSPVQRIETLQLLIPSKEQLDDLEDFLRKAATKPLVPALSELANKKHIWVNSLQIECTSKDITAIELCSWRTNTGKIVKWSGLIEEADEESPPVLILEREAELTGHYSKLEVRWKTRPEDLGRDTIQYRITIVTDMEEEISFREVSHSAKKEQKCRFTNDDFSELSEDALIPAKVIVSVIGNETIELQESEEFVIRFGQPPEQERGGIGKKVRTFSEGLIELQDREMVSTLVSTKANLSVDSKGFVLLRTSQRGKSFRVYQPPLIAEVERQWIERSGEIGRWQIKVRASGSRIGVAEFIPISPSKSSPEASQENLWERVVNASRRMAEHFNTFGGGVGQIYDQNVKVFDNVVKEYLLAWAAVLEEGDPSFALANTVEVQSLSGNTIGLIILPSHAIRVAWHVAFDNLALYAAFDEKKVPIDIRKELSALDGAMFPAFLPGLQDGSCFVFADTLGFHAVGMIPDTDKEPKASVAILARALGDSISTETVPTVGRQSAQVLSNEIIKYIDCHNTSHLLHIHALRPGDGLTIARSLGSVYDHYHRTVEEDIEDTTQEQSPVFVLELYPSEQQRGVAGRFITEIREKRRRGAGALASEDRWMLESLSLPGGVNLPRLRWARKNQQNPNKAAHLAVAFDTFESHVVLEPNTYIAKSRPYYVFGLLSFFEREFSNVPSPMWKSILLYSGEGEKHPSDRAHTDRLLRIQQVIYSCVVRSKGMRDQLPILQTDISPDKAQILRHLHQLCDWVITLDRNAGIEYFDSPQDNKEIYDAYVIDCVPEREDLGCLQLITSTSNLEEVRNLIDSALDQMALSHSRRNAEFLMEHLKALSGRLAMRLTGQKAPTSELIALSLSHANCQDVFESKNCWLPLRQGFFIPVDDIRDLLPPVSENDSDKANDESTKEVRPDLIYVTTIPRKGIIFQFVEIKYRRHLRAARSPQLLENIRLQTQSLHKRWMEWYSNEDVCSSFRAIRRSKLARVLRFYADKGYRHYLPLERYKEICGEIDRMIEKGGSYPFAEISQSDRGWVFCPEYMGVHPLEISPAEWDTRIFLFGPTVLPDSELYHESVFASSTLQSQSSSASLTPQGHETQESTIISDSVEKLTDVSISTSNLGHSSHTDIVEETQEVPSIQLGTNLLTGGEIRWSLTVKGNPHLLMAGLPGMGKTTCLLNLCTQMLISGIRPIIFSYHQDIDDELQRLVKSVRFIDFHGLGFNPLQIINRESQMSYLDIAGVMRDIFLSIFPELGDLQGERIRMAIKQSFIEKGWDIHATTQNKLEEPDFGRFIEILKDEPKPDHGLKSLLVRLEELSDYNFFNLTESNESLWESNNPVLIRIHKTPNDNLQRAFASLIFYRLYKDMFLRGIQNRITHAIILDEAHRAAKLNLIPTMAKECRKYGISLILASQEAKDFNISLFSAIANYLVLRLTETDAKVLVRNVASSDQERTLIDRIKQMERFKAIYFSETQKKPARITLLPPSVLEKGE